MRASRKILWLTLHGSALGPPIVQPQRSPRSRAIAEHFGCSLRLMGFGPMHSGSQRFVRVASQVAAFTPIAVQGCRLKTDRLIPPYSASSRLIPPHYYSQRPARQSGEVGAVCSDPMMEAQHWHLSLQIGELIPHDQPTCHRTRGHVDPSGFSRI